MLQHHVTNCPGTRINVILAEFEGISVNSFTASFMPKRTALMML